jgi:Cu-processing system ATP-binding protein
LFVSLLAVNRAARVFGRRCRRRTALADCSFEADAGEVVGVVGPNGAGKTTLLRLLAGEIALSSGSVTLDGHHAGTRAGRRIVGFAPDPPLAPPELTGSEWLEFLGCHRARTTAARRRLVGSAVEAADLHEFGERRIASYSRGMGQRLALAAAIVCGRRVILLDETLSGIDPLVHRKLRDHVLRLAETSRLVVIASHDLSTVERLATRVLVLSRGHLRADVPMATLAAERVAELTLSGGGLAGIGRVLHRYPGALRTGYGVSIPLTGGITVEQILATLRQDRIAVAASRVRYRALEDILVATAGGEGVPA